jgi:hypothetical protein
MAQTQRRNFRVDARTEHAPSALAGNKTAIWTNGCTPSAFTTELENEYEWERMNER